MANNTTVKIAAIVTVFLVVVITLNINDDPVEETRLSSQSGINDQSTINGAATGVISDDIALEQTPIDGVTSEPAENQTYIEKNIGYLAAAEYGERSQYGELPAHMKDIALMPLYFDADGNFIVSANLIDLVEHFLVSAEIEGKEQSLARSREYIEMVLPEKAAAQALIIMDQYLAYEARIAEEISVDQSEPDINELANQIEQMVERKKAIRREIMPTEVVDAMFGREELLDDFNVTTMRLNLDSTLSYEEKDRRVAQAELLLPPRIQEQKRYHREKKNLEKRIAELKNQEGKESEIYGLRKEFYGEETADRITYYEDNSPEWVAKVKQFNQDRATILRQSGLSEKEYKQQITTLKSGMFTEREQLKLAVYNIRNSVAIAP